MRDQSVTFDGRCSTQPRITSTLESNLAIARPVAGVVEETMTVSGSMTLELR